MPLSGKVLMASGKGRRWRRWGLGVLAVPALVVAGSWYFTESLTDRGGATPSLARPAVEVSSEGKSVGPMVKAPPAWPEGRLEGAAAKVALLDILLGAGERLNRVHDYTASFLKQERIKGKLGPSQTLSIKVRQKPFAVYVKFLNPHAGREIVYAEGHHENKMIAHASGMARLLIPRLAVPPDHPLALADARHPVTEAGLAHLTSKLIGFRRLDLDDSHAETVLDRHRDADGREWLRSVHRHPDRTADRPFARVEVLYDPSSFFPMDIRNYDWPEPGHVGELNLAEHYHYGNLILDPSLSALDFDPANPAYAFHRY